MKSKAAIRPMVHKLCFAKEFVVLLFLSFLHLPAIDSLQQRQPTPLSLTVSPLTTTTTTTTCHHSPLYLHLCHVLQQPQHPPSLWRQQRRQKRHSAISLLMLRYSHKGELEGEGRNSTALISSFQTPTSSILLPIVEEDYDKDEDDDDDDKGLPSSPPSLHRNRRNSLQTTTTISVPSSLSSSPSLTRSSSLSRTTNWLQQTLFLGMEPTPTLWAIVVIYFVEGALGLARLAQTYLLKDELHLGPAELSALQGLLALPWTIKPLYGFLSDGFPLFGYHRKSYLILAGLVGALSYACLGQASFGSNNHNHNSMEDSAAVGTVAALLLSSACIAFSDVVADGIVVQQTRQQQHAHPVPTGDTTTTTSTSTSMTAGGLQSLCWGASAVGGLLSAYFSGSLLEVMTVRQVFGWAAVLPFLVAVIATRMDEAPAVVVPPPSNLKQPQSPPPPALLLSSSSSHDVWEGIKGQIDTLWQALQQPDIWKPALFMFLWQATPTSDGAFFFFLTDESGLGLGLGPEFLGRVRFVTALAGLVGVGLYNAFFRTQSIKSILLGSTLVSVPLGMLPVLLITHVNRDWGIPDTALIYGDDVILAALGQVSFLPILVLAARICPPGVEAVLFATLMSIFNGASTVGTELGAALTHVMGVTEHNFDNLALLTIVCNISSLLPLLCLGLLDGVGDKAEADDFSLIADAAANGSFNHHDRDLLVVETPSISIDQKIV